MPFRHSAATVILLFSVAFCVTLACGQQETDAEFSTWRDISGTYEVEAKLLKVESNVAHLELRESGKVVEVPLTKLANADRLRARAWVKQAAEIQTDEVALADSSDWPTWRGPERNGISKEIGLLKSWPEGGPSMDWQIDGLGTGYSSVAVAGGKIYTLGRIDGKEYIFALDETSGNKLWSALIGNGRKERGPNGTPTIDGDRVYGISIEGDLLCANATTGEAIWRKSFTSDFGGRMMSGWGYSESPLVDGDRLLCTPGGDEAMIVALNKLTGETIWKAPMPAGGDRGNDGAGYSSIVISNAGGRKQYIQLVGRGVISVSDSGELLWGYNRVANGTANVPTPIVKEDLVFCSSGYGDGGSALLKVGRGGVQEIYYKSNNEVQNHHGGMILLGDHVYMGHGHNNGFPLCMELRTGRDIWRPGRGPGSGSAAIAYADGHLYFRYENGVVALIEATPDAYRLKGEFKEPNLNGKAWPQPVIAGGKLYLRDQQNLRRYDVTAPNS